MLGLVVELLGQDKDVLAEVLRLLAQLALDDVAVRLGHLALPLTLAPVEQRHGDAHRDHLVAQQVAVGAVHVVARAGVAQLGVEVDALAVGAGRGHGVVGLHLAAAHGSGEGVVLEGVTQHVVEFEMHLWHIPRRYWLYVCFHVEERAEGELAGLSIALAVGQGTAGGEHVEAQLQHVVLADGAHASLGLAADRNRG